MTFAARIQLDRKTRGYLHSAGCDAFGAAGEDAVQLSERARTHAIGLIYRYSDLMAPSDFLLFSLWGNNGVKTGEFFGYNGMWKWPGNPDITCWVFKNGIYSPEERMIECGDTVIMRGLEENYRRATRDIEEYMAKPPHLGELEPRIQSGISASPEAR